MAPVKGVDVATGREGLTGGLPLLLAPDVVAGLGIGAEAMLTNCGAGVAAVVAMVTPLLGGFPLLDVGGLELMMAL